MRSPDGRGRARRRRRDPRRVRARSARALPVAGPPLLLLQRAAVSGSRVGSGSLRCTTVAAVFRDSVGVQRNGPDPGRALLPGPAAPAVAQTVEWIARPTDLLRRSAARYGEPFTLLTLWADAPMVLVSDPETVKRVYAAPEEVLRGGASSTVLEPFAAPSSILLTSGEAHLRQRKLVLPPFHGPRMEEHRAAIAALAAAEVGSWTPGRPLRTLPRMQDLTLDMILRVVLGAPEPRLRAEIRAALDMTTSLPRLIALSLAPRGSAPWRPFMSAVGRVDTLLRAEIRARMRSGGNAVIDELIAAGATED